MLIGNKGSFALELSFVEPSWELRYGPEAAAWAGLAVWVADANLCAHVRAGEEQLQSTFFIPLGPVANWFVTTHSALMFEERVPWLPTAAGQADGRGGLHDTVRRWGLSPPPKELDEDRWLAAREAFWARHFLTAGADGSWLPNLAFLREDDDVLLSWAPPRFQSGPPISMISPRGSASVKWVDVAAVIARFVEEVTKAFQNRKLAPYVWVTASPPPGGSLSGGPDPLELFCGRDRSAISSILGVGPGELPTALGGGAANDPAGSPVCQVIRDLSPRPAAEIRNVIKTVIDRSASIGSQRSLWMDARGLARDAASAGSTPEEEGYFCARTLRSKANLDGEPVVSTPDLLEQFGVQLEGAKTKSFDDRMVVVAGNSGGPVAAVLETPRTASAWGRRFEEARALGHALLDPLHQGCFGAASSRWAQEKRRRRSGAFAAELLLPSSALEAASGGHLDGATTEGAFRNLLERYVVGARTAANQLYNQRWLSSPAIRDELIDLHGRG